MVCAIEDEFDIEIPNSAIKKFKTVKDVIKFIEKNTDKPVTVCQVILKIFYVIKRA